ncbi:YwqG family protein [Sphingomicrobium sediminis]|uniref:DUF1963 domain-containing protein n=1 Tax=Sphingomicrobium sediminis TaxID=2950949 RepID=A0A9X2EFV0_9SPHN|nr:DUF1963 domain-containing protein [Sphingomicrobium sediminis]MCM8557208.1 DUF1963 domain-containing protein [Sphingomicrobium sediminis]
MIKYALIFAIIVGGILLWRAIRPGASSTDLSRLPGMEEFKKKWENDNPEGPALSEEDINEWKAALDGLALPAAILTPDPSLPVEAGGNRLGGPAYLPAGEAWPKAANGLPAIFLAQIDFTQLPDLPDFPRRGILQLFVASDDLSGMNIDDPTAPDIIALYHRGGLEDAVQQGPYIEPEGEGTSPLMDKAVTEGVALTPTLAMLGVSSSSWQGDEALDGLGRREGFNKLEDHLYDEKRGLPAAHHVGGHPEFVQSDLRFDGNKDFDRVLLRLTSDKYLQWGDVGEANFLIRRDDLVARQFDRLLFTWDCS